MAVRLQMFERLKDAAFIVRGDRRAIFSRRDEDDRMPGGDELLDIR